jgi:hypothetical protein
VEGRLVLAELVAMLVFERDRFRSSLSYLAALALLATSACGDDTGETGDGTESSTNGDEPNTTSPATTVMADSSSSSSSSSSGSSTVADTEEPTAEDTVDTTAGDTDTPVCKADPLTPWAAPEWETNAAVSLALRAQLDTLTGDPTMRGAETGAVMVDATVLDDAWTAGDPSLADVAHAGFAPLAADAFEEFLAVIEAGDQDLMNVMLTAWEPGQAGGIWGDANRGINEGGLEVRQLVDKGGFSGGLHYSYALGLTTGEIDGATIDAIAAAWGSNAALDPEAMPADSASYGFQMGFHADMAAALTAAKAYAEDPMCGAERDEAIVTFFRLWEQSMLARLVFYGNRAAGKLLMAADQSGFADVLHDLGEGAGLALGFYGLPDPSEGPLSGAARTITDADIEAAVGALGIDLTDLGLSTTGEFLESLPMYEAAVEEVEGVVMDVYGVDVATIQSYRMPTPG